MSLDPQNFISYDSCFPYVLHTLRLCFINIVAGCLKAGVSEAEQTSIASKRSDNTHIRRNE
jgi:hypothetical protein